MAGPSGPAFLYNFYPRSPCGERLSAVQELIPLATISIHALLAESDLGTIQHTQIDEHISIHALLAESDCYSLRHSTQGWHFYPRSPCGERQNAHPDIRQPCVISIHALLAESDDNRRIRDADNLTFLSTLSLRRATDCVRYCIHGRGISIHALLAESDSKLAKTSRTEKISIHALLAESDRAGSNLDNCC